MTGDALRGAVGALSPRERRALGQQCREAGEKWSDVLPRIAAVWEALAALVAEVDTHERARQASHPPDHTMRAARRQRT